MSDQLNEIQAAINVFDIEHARELLREALKTPTAETYFLAAQVAINDFQKKQFLEKTLELDPFFEAADRELRQLQNLSSPQVAFKHDEANVTTQFPLPEHSATETGPAESDPQGITIATHLDRAIMLKIAAAFGVIDGVLLVNLVSLDIFSFFVFSLLLTNKLLLAVYYVYIARKNHLQLTVSSALTGSGLVGFFSSIPAGIIIIAWAVLDSGFSPVSIFVFSIINGFFSVIVAAISGAIHTKLYEILPSLQQLSNLENKNIVFVNTALTLLLVMGLCGVPVGLLVNEDNSTPATNIPAQVPTAAPTRIPTTTIEYYTRITSCSRVSIRYNDGIDKSVIATSADNPWSYEFEAPSGQLLAMSVECLEDEFLFEEVVTCVINIEGRQVMFEQDRGKFPITTCVTSAP
jgi:hypothetical protein